MTDWTKLSADLERLLKLRSHVFAMKLFERREPNVPHRVAQGGANVRQRRTRIGWIMTVTGPSFVMTTKCGTK